MSSLNGYSLAHSLRQLYGTGNKESVLSTLEAGVRDNQIVHIDELCSVIQALIEVKRPDLILSVLGHVCTHQNIVRGGNLGTLLRLVCDANDSSLVMEVLCMPEFNKKFSCGRDIAIAVHCLSVNKPLNFLGFMKLLSELEVVKKIMLKPGERGIVESTLKAISYAHPELGGIAVEAKKYFDKLNLLSAHAFLGSAPVVEDAAEEKSLGAT